MSLLLFFCLTERLWEVHTTQTQTKRVGPQEGQGPGGRTEGWMGPCTKVSTISVITNITSHKHSEQPSFDVLSLEGERCRTGP